MTRIIPFKTSGAATLVPDLQVGNVNGLMNLIANLRGEAAALQLEIEAEELRLKQFDPSNIAYPCAAKNCRERLCNLKQTIEALEKRLHHEMNFVFSPNIAPQS
jgi:hypothetical protein